MSKDKVSNSSSSRVTVVGKNVQLASCVSDCHYTTIGVTNLVDGSPVFPVIIFKKKKLLSYTDIHGFDIDAEWEDYAQLFKRLKQKGIIITEAEDLLTEENLQQNTGSGKVFSCGPKCEFQGVTIPMLITKSDSGGITPELLFSVLQHYDCYVPQQDNEIPPAAVIDGHSSCFSLEFLRYIRNLDDNNNRELTSANHKWNAYLGLPNTTHKWQVGDSSQQNGMYKEESQKVKEEIRDCQIQHLETPWIERHHVVYILNKVWSKSFGNVQGNKKAIAMRGWNPLNCALLCEDNKIKRTRVLSEDNTGSGNKSEENKEPNSQNTLASVTNVLDGIALELLLQLSTQYHQNVAAERDAVKQQKELAAKRGNNKWIVNTTNVLTASVFAKNNCHKINEEGVFEGIRERRKKKEKVKHIALSKQHNKDVDTYDKAIALIEKLCKYNIAMASRYNVTKDVNKKKKIKAEIKKGKYWMLSNNWAALICMKQLALMT